MSKVRILSLDGGGLRGIAPLLILKEIEQRTGKRIHELFDIITGTSTGGIIACGLVATLDGVNPILSVDDLIDLYKKNGDIIFPQPKNRINKILVGIKSIFDPKFSEKGLSSLLNENFSTTRLSKSLKPIIVTSYDIKNNEVVMFKSRASNIKDENGEAIYDCDMVDVCRATSAAPTFLPSYIMNYSGKDRVLIDGGVYMNNPTMAAVSDLLKHGNNGEKVFLKDISCLSIGTGEYIKDLNEDKSPDWGVINWARPIATMMMQATSKAVVYESEQIIKKYMRLQFTIDDGSRSDFTDSRPETTEYLINKVNEEILTEDRIKDILKFLK